MFKKIKLINKLLELVGEIQKIAKSNKETVDEIFKILGKVKKVSPELAEIIADIKDLLK